jgi:hypothetical protein
MSPRKCKHENAVAKYGETTHNERGDIIYEVEFCECLDCGVWLSLGDSDESDPRVALEIRAAEIAANLSENGCEMSSLEIAGFNGDPMRLRNGMPIHLDTDAQQSGWLAREIAQHESEHGGER